MRYVLSVLLCALAYPTIAHAQTTVPDWTVKPEAAHPIIQRPSDWEISPGYIPSIAVNSETNGPVNLWILPYRSTWSRLYEPNGYRDDDYLVTLELKKALPQPFAVQLMGVGLRRLYDSKRVKEEDREAIRFRLPTPHETKFALQFKYKLIPSGCKCQ